MNLKLVTKDGTVLTFEVLGWHSLDTEEWACTDIDIADKLGMADLFDMYINFPYQGGKKVRATMDLDKGVKKGDIGMVVGIDKQARTSNVLFETTNIQLDVEDYEVIDASLFDKYIT